MERIIITIVEILTKYLSSEKIVFIISMLPILELRAGLIAAKLLNLPFFTAAMISIIGNIIPIPFILLFIKKIIVWMGSFNPTKKIADFLNEKAIKNKSKIDKYGFLGLVLFVGIPLPGTGAWTGALVASLFEMDIKKSALAILLGILMAFVIMSIISYGLISFII